MSDRAKSLAPWIAVLLSAATLAGAVSLFAAKSAAASEVRPVENRVTRLEAQRGEDVKKIDEVAKDVKELLRRVR